MQAAQELSLKLGHQHVGVEHLLLAMLDDGNSIPSKVFDELKAIEPIRSRLIAIMTAPEYMSCAGLFDEQGNFLGHPRPQADGTWEVVRRGKVVFREDSPDQ
jgi:hypothetical protein